MGKKSKPPKAPDYAALAQQQAVLDKAAADQQTIVNRPDQITPWGTTDWTKGPTGDWTQNISLNPQDQAALDRSRQFEAQQQDIASGLLDQAGTALSKPYSLEGLLELKDFDFSQLPELGGTGFGAVEEVRDAMMGRLGPAREQARQSEIQRLKNQGLSEDSNAFQRAMTRLDQGDTDANQQALLAGMDAYGDIFERSSLGRQQKFGEQDRAAQLAGLLRQQSLTEQQRLRDQPINDYMKLVQGTVPTNPEMPNFMGGTGYQAADMYGAGKDQYAAAMERYNAQQAQKGGLMSGLFGLGGAALGGPMGGMIGKSIFGG